MESALLPYKPTSLSQPPFPENQLTDSHLLQLCNQNQLTQAIALLHSTLKTNLTNKPKPSTVTHLIKACTDTGSISLGRKIHGMVGVLREFDEHVETKLVGMYAKCGCLGDARNVFDGMRVRDLRAWSAMIGGCGRRRRWGEVVELFVRMVGEDDVVPDGFLWPKVLEAVGNCGDLRLGKAAHSMVVRSGLSGHAWVANAVLGVYAKCGELVGATRFFECMEGKDLVSWNTMMTGYCQKGEIEEARRLFERMRVEGIEPGLVTWNILISSYGELGRCDMAMRMVKEMESFGIVPDVFTWSSLISGLVHNNRRVEALEMFPRFKYPNLPESQDSYAPLILDRRKVILFLYEMSEYNLETATE